MLDNRRSRTEVMSEVIFLGNLVERVVAGKIRIPRFQRELVWKQKDILALLDSIQRGFPIGLILVWDTNEKITSTERVGPVIVGPPPDGSVGYVIDGHQRVATLVGTLRMTDEIKNTADEIVNRTGRRMTADEIVS